MMITSGNVAMSSGRAYLRQTKDRSSSFSFGEGYTATSPNAKESKTIKKENENIAQNTYEMFQTYTANRVWKEGMGATVDTASDEKVSTEDKYVSDSSEIFMPLSETAWAKQTTYGEVRMQASRVVFTRVFPVKNKRIMSFNELWEELLDKWKKRFPGLSERMGISDSQIKETLSFMRTDAGSSLEASGVGISDELRGFSVGTPVFRSASIEYKEESHTESERETTRFKTDGKVTTADGREISVDLDLTMSRSLESEYTSAFLEKKLTDPLVINYGYPSANLRDETFSFDIDADGELDNISLLGSMCGYLALDINEDGKINDGSELFGAKTGNGFSELEVYDVDANGWIDENDPIFDKLRIWSKDDDGNDVLVGLGVRGIGAIYLGNAPTEFTIKNDVGDTQAVIRSSGIFLREDGTSGTIQQLDMAKQTA